MSDRILVVTPPDDTLLQGIRVTHVDLTEDQSSIVSNALLQTTLSLTIINYVWKMGNPVECLLDKVYKSDLIIFNADSDNDISMELITGWVAAQPQSHYFGNLKDLHLVNNRAIYNTDDISLLLEKIATYYE